MAASEDILLLNLTRMGDLVQSTPLAVGLKRLHPDARIVAAVHKGFMAAARLMDGVDEVVPIDYLGLREFAKKDGLAATELVAGAEAFIAPILGRRFSMAVNLTHSSSSAFMMYLVDAADKRGAQMVASGHRVVSHRWMQFFHNFATNKQTSPFNLVDIYSLSGGVPVHERHIPLSLRISGEADRWAEAFLAGQAEPGAPGPLIAVQAGASDNHKMWHPSSFIRCCRALRDRASARFLYIGGREEVGLAQKIHDLVDAPGSVMAAGRTDLEQLCALLRRCDLMITNDTGPMHLSAAVGTRVLSLALGPVYYCNTGPYGEGHVVFQPNAACAPCDFKVRCVNPECKNMVQPEAVAAMALRMLAGEPLSERCVPDGPEFAGSMPYLSGLGDDGLVDYVPLVDRPRDDRGRLERAYRRVWADSLLHGRPSPGSGTAVPSRNDGLYPWLAQLEDHAGKGLLAAEDILRHAGKPGKHLDRIKERLDTIRPCGAAIRELGLRVPQLNGLCQMFAFEEENMRQGGLEGAAAENVDIFGNLLRRTRSLAYLLADAEGGPKAATEGRG
jgi:ADP-heptose:LPS heptosyltransferase